jgi:hypothetical protein
MQEGLADGAGEQLPRLVRSISGSYIVLFVTAGEKLRLSLPFSLRGMSVREWKYGGFGEETGAGVCGLCGG